MVADPWPRHAADPGGAGADGYGRVAPVEGRLAATGRHDVNQATWAMLNETEKALLRQVEPKPLRELDEDGLVELHDRIRRARTKYTKLYRRRAGEQVVDDGSRTRAHAAHARTAAKAEAFEGALATVSRQLAKAARASEEALKAERIAAARAGRGSVPAPRSGGTSRPEPAGSGSAKAKRKTPASKRASASSRATTRRAQVKKDRR